MTTVTKTKLTAREQEAVLYWVEVEDIPIFPAYTETKDIYYKEWSTEDFSKVNFREKLAAGDYDNGIAVRLGKTLSGEYYVWCIDLDSWSAVQAWFGKEDTWGKVLRIAEKTRVEWHEDRGRLHIIGKSKEPLHNKHIQVEGGLIEVRCDKQPLFVSPSIHLEGKPYTALNAERITIVDNLFSIKSHIDTLSKNYMSDEDREAFILWLENPKNMQTLGIGTGRHDGLKALGLRYFYKLKDGWHKFNDEERRAKLWNWNSNILVPKSEKEFNEVWDWIVEKHKEQRDKMHEEYREKYEGDNEEDKKQQKITELINIINDKTRKLFVDEHDTAYAVIEIGEHLETLPIKNSRFRRWICKTHYQELQGTLRADQLKQICDLLEAEALFSESVKDLHVRTNAVGSTYYYDLSNKTWQVVEITAGGWQVKESRDVPTMFLRYKNHIPQATPSKEYPPDILDKFLDLINLKSDDDDNRLLLKCYIISLFIPNIPKPILMLHGEQGAAKSTCQDLIKQTVDPSSVLSLAFPRDVSELVQQLSHNYIAYYDNVSIIRDWISDQLCRAVTGSGFTKRQLWTDDDDIIYNFKRCLGINGINLAATKPDLLDRSIIIQLERIPKENRYKVEDIFAKLEVLKPQLLGFIFDTLVKVLQVRNGGGVQIEARSRMADFEESAEIISRCLGYQPNKFIEAYLKNQKLQTDAVIEGSLLATVIVEFMKDEKEWQGKATELLSELEVTAEKLKINTNSTKYYPKAANYLTRRLNEIRTNLLDIGISINYTKDTSTNCNVINITWIVSPVSPYPRKGTENSQNEHKSTGDTLKKPGDMQNVSPAVSPEIRAQNRDSGDTGGTGDTLQGYKTQNQIVVELPKGVSKKYGDTYGCEHCKITGDRWAMQEHVCRGSK